MIDDPFEEPNDPDRTMVRPQPGGGGSPRPLRADGEGAAAVPAIGTNALVTAAAPVLAAAIRIAGGRGAGPDPEQLRRGMTEAVLRFEKDALATGLDTRSLRAARYALCATIDDLVLSTPWGANSTWSQQTLTAIFHNEAEGGERFFEILEQLQKDLGRNAEVVELLYLCLSLGFEGRYRVMPRGSTAFASLRESVYRLLRNRRGDFERELSPHWRGVATGRRSLGQSVPLWAIPLAAVTVGAFLYLGFNLSLAGASDIGAAEFDGLPPQGAPVPPRPVAVAFPTPAAPAAPAPKPPASAVAANLHQFLAPEIKAGLVSVFEDPQAMTIRLSNRNMFAAGEATPSGSAAQLLGRIGEALQDEPGAVAVNGYTDNQPIHTARFPSNFELSQARADAAAKLISARLADPKRVHGTGKSDGDPIASNATPDGRQQNRRTEIVLTRTAASP